MKKERCEEEAMGRLREKQRERSKWDSMLVNLRDRRATKMFLILIVVRFFSNSKVTCGDSKFRYN